jgi:ankyrin repeat protein
MNDSTTKSRGRRTERGKEKTPRHEIGYEKNTFFSSCLVNGHEAVLKMLLARNDVEVDPRDESGQTPLWHAAREGHEAVVKMLPGRDDVEADPRDKYRQPCHYQSSPL